MIKLCLMPLPSILLVTPGDNWRTRFHQLGARRPVYKQYGPGHFHACFRGGTEYRSLK